LRPIEATAVAIVQVTVSVVLPVLEAAEDKYVDITRGTALTAQLSTTVTDTFIVPVEVAAPAAFGATSDVANASAKALRLAARRNFITMRALFCRARYQTLTPETPPKYLAT
jgi:hypothetical protein